MRDTMPFVPASHAPSDVQQKHVPRATQACTTCKRRKIKCDETRPSCFSCRKRGNTCTYAGANSRPESRDSRIEAIDLANQRLKKLSSQGVHAFREYSSSGERPTGISVSSGSSTPDEGARREGDAADTSSPQLASAAVSPPPIPSNGNASELTPVEGTNKHTQGKEFYGTSSNFSLLSQLINQARSRMTASAESLDDNRVEQTAGSNTTRDQTPLDYVSRTSVAAVPEKRLLKIGRISLVNLLADGDIGVPALVPAVRRPPSFTVSNMRGTKRHLEVDSTGLQSSKRTDVSSKERSISHVEQDHNCRSQTDSSRTAGLLCPSWVQMQLEKEYVRLFFENLHYIHPFLCQPAFTARCEREVWNHIKLQDERSCDSHFLALYNAVIAVGALTAGKHVHETLRSALAAGQYGNIPIPEASVPSSIDLSKVYFARAKQSLGDYFEVCSLEGVQTLVLMSLYSQNALRPHACYMYSGMAVRSALAMGLPDECKPKSATKHNEVKKTWWAVYSQEVDMCCSSGRRSISLAPERYRLPLPAGDVDGNISSIDMITQMVHFAAILLRISLQLYHEPQPLSEQTKSDLASNLQSDLSAWRSNLPSWLKPGFHSFTEPEWVGKQRLVLQLRFYNAQILIHRPLIAASSAQSIDTTRFHTAACLEGARMTIDLLHEAYTHRHYFRTWYYNATYTLYASMLILYVILIDYSHASKDELITDVERSIEILQAMDNIKVARRCASLIMEVLEVARNHRDSSQAKQGGKHYAANLLSEADAQYRVHTASDADVQRNGDSNMDVTRNDLLATLIDPITLEGFASDAGATQGISFNYDWDLLSPSLWTDIGSTETLFTNLEGVS